MSFLKKIITTGFVLALHAAFAHPADSVLQDMAVAYKKNDQKILNQLLPKAKGHPLESWAAYFQLKLRLERADEREVEDFLTRYAGTYIEDRLRADWLLQLGTRRNWEGFARHYANYRMRDDKDIRCYALYLEQPTPATSLEIEKLWMGQKEINSGCGFVAQALMDSSKMAPLVAWRKSFQQKELQNAKQQREFDLQVAQLKLPERDWVLGLQGMHQAQQLDLTCLATFEKVLEFKNLSDDMLAWWARALLRRATLNSKNDVNSWRQLSRVIAAMSASAKQDSTWIYWQARSVQVLQGMAQAAPIYESIAADRLSSSGFYEQLAAQALGRQMNPFAQARPAPLSAAEKSQASSNRGLQRALLAINLGLREYGVREWNYETNLAKVGGMTDRERLAAADMACDVKVWDRCINTSERTKSEVDWAQRFPMPHFDQVSRYTKELKLDTAYVYGLMRQESRFVDDARSGVGASGLMQIMPKTAAWVAKKISYPNFHVGKLADLEANIALGANYLKLVLDEFEEGGAESGAHALAAAAYNAGPKRARMWRDAMTQSGEVETAVWAENVPFSETRDYVKKVLANTSVYAAVISQQAQFISVQLGAIKPNKLQNTQNLATP